MVVQPSCWVQSWSRSVLIQSFRCWNCVCFALYQNYSPLLTQLLFPKRKILDKKLVWVTSIMSLLYLYVHVGFTAVQWWHIAQHPRHQPFVFKKSLLWVSQHCGNELQWRVSNTFLENMSNFYVWSNIMLAACDYKLPCLIPIMGFRTIFGWRSGTSCRTAFPSWAQ